MLGGLFVLLISIGWVFAVLFALVFLWRSLKTQEAMAASLERIERILAETRE
jgi:hypothetical protein